MLDQKQSWQLGLFVRFLTILGVSALIANIAGIAGHFSSLTGALIVTLFVVVVSIWISNGHCRITHVSLAGAVATVLPAFVSQLTFLYLSRQNLSPAEIPYPFAELCRPTGQNSLTLVSACFAIASGVFALLQPLLSNGLWLAPVSSSSGRKRVFRQERLGKVVAFAYWSLVTGCTIAVISVFLFRVDVVSDLCFAMFLAD